MSVIKDYLISIAAVSMITSIILGITKKNGAVSAIVKLLAGLFVTISVLNPLIGIRLGSAQTYFEQLSINGADAANFGQFAAEEEMKELISERCQSYVYEKARSLGADIVVDVYLHELLPSSVVISGAISPNAKKQLSDYITENLGVSLEDQQWIG